MGPILWFLRLFDLTERLAEQLRYIGDGSHGTLVMHAGGAKHAKRTLHEVVARVARADEGEVFTSLRNFLDADLNENRFGRIDASVQHGDEPVFFFNRREQVAQLRLIGKLRSSDNPRGTLDVDLLAGRFAEHGRVAESEGAASDCVVALALADKFLQQVGADGFQDPAGVVAVQKIGSRVEFGLGKGT